MICHGLILTMLLLIHLTLPHSRVVLLNAYNMSAMFSRAGANFTNSELTHDHTLNLDTSCFDTSNVHYMYEMFQGTKPNSLILTNFDTSKVLSMGGMFGSIYYLTDATFDISSFDTSSVTNMSSMFKQFYGVSTLDLSHWDTSNVTNMGSMFSAGICGTDLTLEDYLQFGDCNPSFVNPPTSIILTNWNTQNVENMGNIFEVVLFLHLILAALTLQSNTYGRYVSP